jgi:hypothetical protein
MILFVDVSRNDGDDHFERQRRHQSQKVEVSQAAISVDEGQ